MRGEEASVDELTLGNEGTGRYGSIKLHMDGVK